MSATMLFLLVCCCSVGLATAPSREYHTWTMLLQDTQLAGSPDAEDFRESIEASGMTFLRQMTTPRYPISLWILEGTDEQFERFSNHSTGPHASSRYIIASSKKGRSTVRIHGGRNAKVFGRAKAAAAAGNWGVDRIDQRSLPLDGNYDPGLAGAGVNVYVVDTGVSYHVDLAGRVIQEFTVFPGPPEQALDDENGHGTHVAGLAAGTIYGVAKQATIRSYRVLDAAGSGTLADLATGLFAVLSDFVPPAVINLSLEYLGSDSTIDGIISQLLAAKVAIFAAGGNFGTDSCSQPAAVPGVVAVGASTIADTAASYSNRGSCIDFFAPGDQLLSAWIDNGTRVLSGTSMACAVASGAGALLLGGYPASTPAQVGNGIVAGATLGALSSIGSGSPNRLLYAVGLAPSSGTTSSSPNPPAPPPPSSSASASNILASSATTSSWLMALLVFLVN